MIKIYSIKVKDTDKLQIDKIIDLKSQAWKYSKDEHLRWLQSNLDAMDEHVIVEDESFIAYLNLVNLTIEVDGSREEALGIGNVCVACEKKGKGYGSLIMSAVNSILKERNKMGVLLCKEGLRAFYSKACWKEVPSNVGVLVNQKEFEHHTFLFNFTRLPKKTLSIDKAF